MLRERGIGGRGEVARTIAQNLYDVNSARRRLARTISPD